MDQGLGLWTISLHIYIYIYVYIYIYNIGRGNALGAEGWGLVLGAAAGLAGLTAVEPLGAAWRGLLEGRLESLELGGKLKGEAGLAGVVAGGYLGRSASCLTRLDMGWPPPARPLALKSVIIIITRACPSHARINNNNNNNNNNNSESSHFCDYFLLH